MKKYRDQIDESMVNVVLAIPNNCHSFRFQPLLGWGQLLLVIDQQGAENSVVTFFECITFSGPSLKAH